MYALQYAANRSEPLRRLLNGSGDGSTAAFGPALTRVVSWP